MRFAKNINQVNLLGTISAEPRFHQTPEGVNVCSFPVCTTRRFKNSAGEKKEDVEFTTITAWDKLADICNKVLEKECKVYISGRLKTIKGTNIHGESTYSTEVVAGDVIVVSRPEEAKRFDENFDMIVSDQ